MAANGNTQPLFIGSIKNGYVSILPGNGVGTDLDGTNALELFEAGAYGARIEKLVIKHKADNALDTVIRVIIDNGTTKYLYREIAIPLVGTIIHTAENPGVTVKPADGFINLGPNEKVLVISSQSVSIDILAFGGDF